MTAICKDDDHDLEIDHPIKLEKVVIPAALCGTVKANAFMTTCKKCGAKKKMAVSPDWGMGADIKRYLEEKVGT